MAISAISVSRAFQATTGRSPRFSPSRRTARIPGLFAVGDAYCHTDPTLAHGLAFGLIHAAAVAEAVDEHDDPDDAVAAYTAATLPALRERYEWITTLDEQRYAVWRGDSVDFAHHDGAYSLFTMIAGASVARTDPRVFRVFNRRIGLLDSTATLDEDLALRRHIQERFQALRATPPASLGPTRDDMLTVITEACHGTVGPRGGRGEAMLIAARRLFDGAADTISADPVIEVSAGRIVRISQGRVSRDDSNVIDLGDVTLLPGLVDPPSAPGLRRLDRSGRSPCGGRRRDVAAAHAARGATCVKRGRHDDP